MKFSIKSKTLGKTLTFSTSGIESGYVYVDLNDQPGILGNQICEGGKLVGSTIEQKEPNESSFEKTCRAWYKKYLAQQRTLYPELH